MFSVFGIPFLGQAYARRRNPDLVVIFARFFCDTNFTSSIAVRDAVDLRYRYHQYNALRKLTAGAVDHGAVARELAENTVAAGEQHEEVLEEVAKEGREMALSDERVDQDELGRTHTSLVSKTTGLIRISLCGLVVHWFDHSGKGLCVVNSLTLAVSPNTPSSFEAYGVVIEVKFDLEDPPTM
ncbi:hypothetical protein LTR50_004426 [Elasticomyces elasticus]|nr:hypothetical protein LTR50_004426 [Elasticomyces elasticus]